MTKARANAARAVAYSITTLGDSTAGVHLHLRSAYRGRPSWPRRPGGRATGGRVLGRRRARWATTCECCSCAVAPGEPLYEVLTFDGEIEVCILCVGPAA
jgi:hypothetical protein